MYKEKYTASLNVYGAEESDEYEFEKLFDGDLDSCIDKLQEYQTIIEDNKLDAYLSLASWDDRIYFEGDLYRILDLLDTESKE